MPKLHSDKGSGNAIDIGFSMYPTWINIIMHDKNHSLALTDAQNGVNLLPGKYYVKIDVISSHQEMTTKKQDFVIGQSLGTRRWSQSLGDLHQKYKDQLCGLIVAPP
jgi:hypothetical protein